MSIYTLLPPTIMEYILFLSPRETLTKTDHIQATEHAFPQSKGWVSSSIPSTTKELDTTAIKESYLENSKIFGD